METIFNETHIDQEVHSPIYGNGTIIEYADDGCGTYIRCDFGKYQPIYDLWGKSSAYDKYPSLSFGHKPDITFDYGEPKLAKFKFTGIPTWCWVYEKEDFVVCLVIGFTENKSYVYCLGKRGNTDIHRIDYADNVTPLTPKELTANNLRNIIQK